MISQELVGRCGIYCGACNIYRAHAIMNKRESISPINITVKLNKSHAKGVEDLQKLAGVMDVRF